MDLIVEGRAVVPATTASGILELLTGEQLPSGSLRPADPEQLFVAVFRSLQAASLSAGQPIIDVRRLIERAVCENARPRFQIGKTD